MSSGHRGSDGDDKTQNIPMEKWVLKTAVKACLIVLAVLMGIGMVMEFGYLKAISFILALTWCLIGLYTLVVVAPKNIIPEARRIGSTNKGITSVASGIIIAIIWASIVTRLDPSGLGPGIKVGHLIQWGFIFALSHIIARVIWAFLQPKDGNKATQANSSKTSSVKPPPDNNPVSAEKFEPTGTELPEERMAGLTAMLEVLNKADDILYQSNNPDDEVNLAKQLLNSPEDAISAIEHRGWNKRGAAEETNRFALRILGRILNNAEGPVKEKAVDALVQIFATRDDNSEHWVRMIEQSAVIIAKSKMLGAKDKLIELKAKVSGKNLQAIDYALNLLASSEK